ncbi:Uma2 family endonuclease [Thermoanaerobacter indiensis]|uniref:Uma2 family endonuclease n=1 Tax=Thermoanaerobacter indiensis TaxID=1125974 RepID=UPI00037E6635|nr:Uma2 family endonuclease [Thermoanaerobacter indiensis]
MEFPIKHNIYTYSDYLKLEDGERVELIEGNFVAMSPSPSRIHQKIITEISRVIGNFIKEKNLECEVYVAPFDVRLIDKDETEENCKNVVQPDISVICDKSKLDDKGLKGAPDFIIEVVSPSNASIDYVKKLYLYEKFKVKEYWIVNPISKNIFVYKLDEKGQYSEPEKYTIEDTIKVNIFKELEINIAKLIK